VGCKCNLRGFGELNTFTFQGGVSKPRTHLTEKLLLFVITPYGNELSIFDAKKMGLVRETSSSDLLPANNPWEPFRRLTAEPVSYTSTLPNIKVFVHQVGHNIASTYYSWYINLDEDGPKITIRPFSGRNSPLIFTANGNVLTREEIKDKLKLKEWNSTWVDSELNKPPVEILNSMIEIEQIDRKKNFRKIRIRSDR